MTLSQWILFALALQLIHFLGTWKLYQAAGFKAWQAAIPVYNAVVLMKIINRPQWWVILLFIPTINLILFGVIWVETIRSFGKNKASDTALVLLTFGLSIFSLNYSKNPQHISDRSLKPRTGIGETISSILFAVVAATIVHNYLIQPYIIPTGSLEKSLLIGDFLFVSKFHYGARAPMTAVSFPMVHDTLPGLKIRSYLKNPQLPYFRLPALQKIKRNDIVVFSWPADTVRQFFVKEKRVDKPIDKKSNYVKRCVAIPGDTLEVIEGLVHTNGKRNQYSSRTQIQFSHSAYAQKGISSRNLLGAGFESFYRSFKIENINEQSYKALIPHIIGTRGNTIDNFVVLTESKGLPLELIRKLGLRVSELLETKKELLLTLNEAEQLSKVAGIDSVVRRISKNKVPNETFFPNKIPFDWNEDNFGPLVIPEKGMTVSLNKSNLPLYKKIITDYELNQLETTPDQIRINGKSSTSYTFQKDYYWMMGDNRHRSEDSRFWGFVPDDHIVGKPIFIWFSIKGINDGIKNWSIRWDRVFTTVDGPGARYSYFPYFIGFVILWQAYSYYRKKKKENSGMKAVITPAYLPNIYYLSWLLNQEKIFFTADTHYQKQTFRNRCEIYGPNGKLKLTIPITHQKAQLHQKENEVQIAFVSAWQKQHWKSLCAAYRSSPYFEFYEADIHPFYTNKTALLFEFNLALLEKIMALIEFPFKYELISWDPSLHYRMDGIIEAKKKKVLNLLPYHQVFQNKFGFIENLSILDLLFNLGPNTLDYLKKQALEY